MRIIALPDEKGEISNTTMTFNLGSVQVEMGRCLLLLDTDLQAECLYSAIAVVIVSELAPLPYAVLTNHPSLTELIIPYPTCDLSEVPVHRRLVTIGVETAVPSNVGLCRASSVLASDAYDYILIEYRPWLDPSAGSGQAPLPINSISGAGELPILRDVALRLSQRLPILMCTVNGVCPVGDDSDLQIRGLRRT